MSPSGIAQNFLLCRTEDPAFDGDAVHHAPIRYGCLAGQNIQTFSSVRLAILPAARDLAKEIGPELLQNVDRHTESHLLTAIGKRITPQGMMAGTPRR
jgi:hypothetical protein